MEAISETANSLPWIKDPGLRSSVYEFFSERNRLAQVDFEIAEVNNQHALALEQVRTQYEPTSVMLSDERKRVLETLDSRNTSLRSNLNAYLKSDLVQADVEDVVIVDWVLNHRDPKLDLDKVIADYRGMLPGAFVLATEFIGSIEVLDMAEIRVFGGGTLSQKPRFKYSPLYNPKYSMDFQGESRDFYIYDRGERKPRRFLTTEDDVELVLDTWTAQNLQRLNEGVEWGLDSAESMTTLLCDIENVGELGRDVRGLGELKSRALAKIEANFSKLTHSRLQEVLPSVRRIDQSVYERLEACLIKYAIDPLELYNYNLDPYDSDSLDSLIAEVWAKSEQRGWKDITELEQERARFEAMKHIAEVVLTQLADFDDQTADVTE